MGRCGEGRERRRRREKRKADKKEQMMGKGSEVMIKERNLKT